MKPEAQRIAIAEACGWRFVNYGPSTSPVLYWRIFDPSGKLVQDRVTGNDFRSLYVPNFLNDLNAMHEAEKAVGLHDEDFTGRKRKRTWAIHIRASDPRFATAAQRAEALLRTLNLWQE